MVIVYGKIIDELKKFDDAGSTVSKYILVGGLMLILDRK